MKIAVIGATGRTGRQVVSQALARGHEVVAIARSPQALQNRAERLSVVGADVRDADAVARAIDGSEGVVSAIGAASGRSPTDLYSIGMVNVLRAIDRGWARRLAAISAAPAGPWSAQPAVFRMVVGPILERLFGGAYADMRVMEATLAQRDDLDWSCLRPPRLVARPAVGRYRLGLEPLPRTRSLTYPDLASALLDCVDDGERRHGMLYVAN